MWCVVLVHPRPSPSHTRPLLLLLHCVLKTHPLTSLSQVVLRPVRLAVEAIAEADAAALGPHKTPAVLAVAMPAPSAAETRFKVGTYPVSGGGGHDGSAAASLNKALYDDIQDEDLVTGMADDDTDQLATREETALWHLRSVAAAAAAAVSRALHHPPEKVANKDCGVPSIFTKRELDALAKNPGTDKAAGIMRFYEAFLRPPGSSAGAQSRQRLQVIFDVSRKVRQPLFVGPTQEYFSQQLWQVTMPSGAPTDLWKTCTEAGLARDKWRHTAAYEALLNGKADPFPYATLGLNSVVDALWDNCEFDFAGNIHQHTGEGKMHVTIPCYDHCPSELVEETLDSAHPHGAWRKLSPFPRDPNDTYADAASMVATDDDYDQAAAYFADRVAQTVSERNRQVPIGEQKAPFHRPPPNPQTSVICPKMHRHMGWVIPHNLSDGKTHRLLLENCVLLYCKGVAELAKRFPGAVEFTVPPTADLMNPGDPLQQTWPIKIKLLKFSVFILRGIQGWSDGQPANGINVLWDDCRDGKVLPKAHGECEFTLAYNTDGDSWDGAPAVYVGSVYEQGIGQFHCFMNAIFKTNGANHRSILLSMYRPAAAVDPVAGRKDGGKLQYVVKSKDPSQAEDETAGVMVSTFVHACQDAVASATSSAPDLEKTPERKRRKTGDGEEDVVEDETLQVLELMVNRGTECSSFDGVLTHAMQLDSCLGLKAGYKRFDPSFYRANQRVLHPVFAANNGTVYTPMLLREMWFRAKLSPLQVAVQDTISAGRATQPNGTHRSDGCDESVENAVQSLRARYGYTWLGASMIDKIRAYCRSGLGGHALGPNGEQLFGDADYPLDPRERTSHIAIPPLGRLFAHRYQLWDGFLAGRGTSTAKLGADGTTVTHQLDDLVTMEGEPLGSNHPRSQEIGRSRIVALANRRHFNTGAPPPPPPPHALAKVDELELGSTARKLLRWVQQHSVDADDLCYGRVTASGYVNTPCAVGELGSGNAAFTMTTLRRELWDRANANVSQYTVALPKTQQAYADNKITRSDHARNLAKARAADWAAAPPAVAPLSRPSQVTVGFSKAPPRDASNVNPMLEALRRNVLSRRAALRHEMLAPDIPSPASTLVSSPRHSTQGESMSSETEESTNTEAATLLAQLDVGSSQDTQSTDPGQHG